MSKSVAYKHYLRAISLWPKDRLRPDCQFQDMLLRRVNRTFLATPASGLETGEPIPAPAVDEKRELARANAVYSLLDDRYALKFKPKGTLMRPASNPTHYTDILHELEAAPDRGTWDRIKNRVAGLFRLS